MYGKVFSSMYEGTLYGHWQAIVAFQQMIVLCDADGIVDMTPQAIAARTSIPLEIIQEGIRILEQPDEYTRTPGEDGKRIVRLDGHRPWGWRIVNHRVYRELVAAEDKRRADRERIAAKRAEDRDASQSVASSRNKSRQSQEVANVAHTEAEAEEEKNPPTPQGGLIGLDPSAWDRWLEYRRELRKPLKPASILAAQRKLAAFGCDQSAVVEQSIAQGWTGLFPLKSRSAGGGRGFQP